MVTHEEEVAARARRIVRMKDGLIISDERNRAPAVKNLKEIAEANQTRIEQIISKEHFEIS